MSKQIPIAWLPWPGALNTTEAALFLRTSRQTVYERTKLPKSDPRRLRKTSYGKYPYFELVRHQHAELGDF